MCQVQGASATWIAWVGFGSVGMGRRKRLETETLGFGWKPWVFSKPYVFCGSGGSRYMYICIYVYTYIRIYVYMYICIYCVWPIVCNSFHKLEHDFCTEENTKEHDLEHDFCTEGSTKKHDLEHDFCTEGSTKKHDLEHDFCTEGAPKSTI